MLRQWPYPNAERLVVVRTDVSQYFSAPALTAAEAHGFVMDFAGQAVLVNGHRVPQEALTLLGLVRQSGARLLHPSLARPASLSS